MSTSDSTFCVMTSPSYAQPPRRSTTALALTLGFCLAVLGACRSQSSAAEPALDPGTADLIEQAEAAERQRRYDRARSLYQEAKHRAPDSSSRARAARAFGRALIFWGEYDGATAELEEAARLTPSDAGVWHDLGILRHERGDFADAEAAFRRSIDVRPRDPRSRIALAALLWGQSRFGDALEQYEALAALDDLPPRVRDKVDWAIRTLRTRIAEEPRGGP